MLVVLCDVIVLRTWGWLMCRVFGDIVCICNVCAVGEVDLMGIYVVGVGWSPVLRRLGW